MTVGDPVITRQSRLTELVEREASGIKGIPGGSNGFLWCAAYDCNYEHYDQSFSLFERRQGQSDWLGPVPFVDLAIPAFLAIELGYE